MKLPSWLGFSSANSTGTTTTETTSDTTTTTPSSPSSTISKASSQPVLSIGKSPTSTSSTPTSSTSITTKSDELLNDLTLFNFFYTVDQRLEQSQILKPDELNRLESLGHQATMDDCEVLLDIVEYFEGKHWEVRSNLIRIYEERKRGWGMGSCNEVEREYYGNNSSTVDLNCQQSVY